MTLTYLAKMDTFCMDLQGTGISLSLDPCGVTTASAQSLQNQTNAQAVAALSNLAQYGVGAAIALATKQPIPAPKPIPEPNALSGAKP
jgi:hypothetical protein